MTKLISMAHKPGDGEAVPMPTQSEYPYQLRVTLNEPQLEALGFKSLPEAGTELHLEAIAVVTRAATEDPDADGDVDYVCVELQLTQLGIEEASAEEEPQDKVSRRDRALSKLWGKNGPKKVGERNVGGTPEKGEFGAFSRRVGA